MKCFLCINKGVGISKNGGQYDFLIIDLNYNGMHATYRDFYNKIAKDVMDLEVNVVEKNGKWIIEELDLQLSYAIYLQLRLWNLLEKN